MKEFRTKKDIEGYVPESSIFKGRPPRPFEDCYDIEDRGHDSFCWIWNRAQNGNGYGHLGRYGTHWMAHRFSWEFIANRHLEKGFDLDHLCRIRLCVNPDHLEPVSRTENLRRGLGTKIDIDIARRIRRRHNELRSTPTKGGRPRKNLPRGALQLISKEFSVHPRMIDHIAKEQFWLER